MAPLPDTALARPFGLGGSAVETARLLRRRRLTLPKGWVGRRVAFADGTRSDIYRETVRVGVALADLAVLVVRFRLRAIGTHPLPHAASRVESIANTLLFAGFPGFRSKLWMTDLDTGFYRGVYEWDGPGRAAGYTDRLCRLLEVFCDRVEAHVEPGVRRGPFLDGQARTADGNEGQWWRPVGWVT